MTDYYDVNRPTEASIEEIDLGQILDALKRNWRWLLLAPAVVAGATYFWFREKPPVYIATAKLMAAPADTNNRLLTGTGANASQLPEGAVNEVARSPKVVNHIQNLVAGSGLPKAVKKNINRRLRRELSAGTFGSIAIKSKVDLYGRGVYEITANSGTPDAARVLANSSSLAIRTWDANRLKGGIVQAKNNINNQIKSIENSLKTDLSGAERQSLVAAKGQLLLDLSQATAMERAIVGSLSMLSEATTPSAPSAPKPMRNAVLAALLTLFMTASIVSVIDIIRRKIRSAGDLVNMGFNVLGEFPKLAYIARDQTTHAARSGDLQQPAGFTRVHLDANIEMLHMDNYGEVRPAMITVTSARPGEGKSSMVAALATAYASSQRRVLIIDMDMHRPQQQKMWRLDGAPLVPLPKSIEARSGYISEAIEEPDYAGAFSVGPNIDVLPTKIERNQAAALISKPHFGKLLERWSQGYDIIIIDTAPVLAVSDAFAIARHTDGLVVVVEHAQTTYQELRKVEQDISVNRIRVLGAILNKLPRKSLDKYRYNYGDTVPSRGFMGRMGGGGRSRGQESWAALEERAAPPLSSHDNATVDGLGVERGRLHNEQARRRAAPTSEAEIQSRHERGSHRGRSVGHAATYEGDENK